MAYGVEVRKVRDVRGGRRQRVATVVATLLIALGFTGFALGQQGWHAIGAVSPPSASTLTSPSSPAPASPTPTPDESTNPVAPRAAGPVVGPATFAYAGGGPLLGTAGGLRRYKVAVEHETGEHPAEFAAEVDVILGDPRSWIASGQLRLQRVPEGAAANFTVFLATPATSEAMCAAAGVRTARYTSCRTSGRVIINLARWRTSVPNYGAALAVYRAYVVNHEVGHELGNRHELCPAAGQPAPVMQQQTLGLSGCLANAWPYIEGRRYAGPRAR
jgi:hypothetical protein